MHCIISYGLGLFTMLFIIIFLESSFDPYSFTYKKEGTYSNNYRDRVVPSVIRTLCTYCKVKGKRIYTYSLYCEKCRVHYCTVHSYRKHIEC